MLCEDEMGDLCRTFNKMANAIRDREQERLHFVATVAHDLKSPLTVIGMAACLMRKKQLPPAQQDEWLGRIVRNTKQLEGIVADLTDGVQAQTGQLELRREELIWRNWRRVWCASKKRSPATRPRRCLTPPYAAL